MVPESLLDSRDVIVLTDEYATTSTKKKKDKDYIYSSGRFMKTGSTNVLK